MVDGWMDVCVCGCVSSPVCVPAGMGRGPRRPRRAPPGGSQRAPLVRAQRGCTSALRPSAPAGLPASSNRSSMVGVASAMECGGRMVFSVGDWDHAVVDRRSMVDRRRAGIAPQSCELEGRQASSRVVSAVALHAQVWARRSASPHTRPVGPAYLPSARSTPARPPLESTPDRPLAAPPIPAPVIPLSGTCVPSLPGSDSRDLAPAARIALRRRRAQPLSSLGHPRSTLPSRSPIFDDRPSPAVDGQPGAQHRALRVDCLAGPRGKPGADLERRGRMGRPGSNGHRCMQRAQCQRAPFDDRRSHARRGDRVKRTRPEA